MNLYRVTYTNPQHIDEYQFIIAATIQLALTKALNTRLVAPDETPYEVESITAISRNVQVAE